MDLDRRAPWKYAVTVLLLLLAGGLALPTAAADTAAGLTWSATVDGRAPADVDAGRPLLLVPTRPSRLLIEMSNAGPDTVEVRSVRLSGRVIGLTFFSYTVRLNVTLAAGEETQRNVDLEMDDLDRQATGLIPAQLLLIGADRQPLGRPTDAPVKVDGSLVSVYGVFGLSVACITLLLVGGLLLAIRRRSLPRNRWQRALRFLPVGIGFGLTLTFSMSATELLMPDAKSWLSFVLVCGGGAFLLGYLLPTGRDETQTAAPAGPLPAPTSVDASASR